MLSYPISSMYKSGFSLLLLLFVCLNLIGCQSFQEPSNSVLRSALTFQSDLIDSDLYPSIGFKGRTSEIKDVEVDEITTIPTDRSKILYIKGIFTWNLLGETTKTNSSFHIHLERGEKNQSWRLARPILSNQGEIIGWKTYPIPID